MNVRQKLDNIAHGRGKRIEHLLGSIVMILAVAFTCYFLIIHTKSLNAILLASTLAVFVILWKPVLGMAMYLIIYPMVPASESLNLLKVAMFGLVVLLFGIWLIHKSMQKESFLSNSEYRWLYIFFFFLCFSPLIGWDRFSMIDWARDIAPLLNLLLIPVMVDYFKKKENQWLMYLFFVPLVFSMIRDILVLLSRYGISFIDFSVLTLVSLATAHPSLLFGIGLLAFLYKVPHKWFWLLLASMGLMIAFLTHTRTVWITTLTMCLLVVVFSSRKRLWATLSIGIMVVLMGTMLFTKGPDTYLPTQKERFHKLMEYHYDLSWKNRVEEFKQAGNLFISSPIYGVGFGYQYNFWKPFVTKKGPGYLYTNFTHNDLMFIVSKGGLIGFIFSILMLYGLMRRLLQRRNEKYGSLQSFWATFALVMIINSLIIGLSTPFYQTRMSTFGFAVLLAFALGYKESVNDAKQT